MERKEYVRIKYDDIPLEFCDEYKLDLYVRKLANDLLCKRLEAGRYFEAPTTPGLSRHTWRPVQFVLIVNDFGVEYVSKQHADHLLSVFKQHYKISEDWNGSKFAGTDLEWTYGPRHQDRRRRLAIQDYIGNLLFRKGHKAPTKPQSSLHRHSEIRYGAEQQFTPRSDDSAPLDEGGVKCVQRI
ncbi:hypothetical protein ACHAWF_005768, partial [Thalassiosira exigua]